MNSKPSITPLSIHITIHRQQKLIHRYESRDEDSRIARLEKEVAARDSEIRKAKVKKKFHVTQPNVRKRPSSTSWNF